MFNDKKNHICRCDIYKICVASDIIFWYAHQEAIGL